MDEPGVTKWVWSPTSDQYKEWQGEMSHPEVVRMLWEGTPDWEPIAQGQWWGGSHSNSGDMTHIYWYPALYASSGEAKRAAPLELLNHLMKRRQRLII